MQWHAIIDPSFATTSTLDYSAAGIRVTGPLTSASSGKGVSHGTLTPDANGTLTYVSQSNIADIRETADLPDGTQFRAMFDRVVTGATVHAISPGALSRVIHGISAIAQMQDGPGTALTPAQRDAVATLIHTSRDIIGGVALTGTAEGIRLQGNAFSATVNRVSFGEDFGTRDGKLSLGLQIGIEGLDSPMIPPGVYRAFLPHKITVNPRLTGLTPDDLETLIRHRVEDGGNDQQAAQAEVMAMFAATHLNLALEEISFDFGPASLDGNISCDIAGPNDITADGDITITGLDALIKRANTTPELKQIAPVLIFLKGIGTQDGDETSFAISYENGSLKVNDTDLTSMIPAGKP
jgi:hypothetical protein